MFNHQTAILHDLNARPSQCFGGWLVASFGAGQAFLVDAATFLVSATAIFLMRPRPLEREEGDGSSLLRDVREGFAFVTYERQPQTFTESHMNQYGSY